MNDDNKEFFTMKHFSMWIIHVQSVDLFDLVDGNENSPADKKYEYYSVLNIIQICLLQLGFGIIFFLMLKSMKKFRNYSYAKYKWDIMKYGISILIFGVINGINNSLTEISIHEWSNNCQDDATFNKCINSEVILGEYWITIGEIYNLSFLVVVAIILYTKVIEDYIALFSKHQTQRIVSIW